MNKEQKQEAVKEIGAAIEGSSAVFAVDYRGISVPQAAELRGKLREADASFSIVKNRLAKRVTGDVGAAELDEHLVGPTALTYVNGDPVVAAKAISDFIKEHEILAYKGGIMDGKALDAEGFRAISRLPGVEVLHGQLVGLAASPLTGLVTGLNGLIQGLATQLGKISEQGLIGNDAPAEEQADAAPAEEAEAAPEPEGSEQESAPEAAEAEGSEDAGSGDGADAAAEAEASEAASEEDPAEPEGEADPEPEGEGEAAAETEAEAEADAEN